MNIVEYMKKENFEDITIALMDMEKNNGKNLSSKQYDSLKKVHDYYLNEKSNLTDSSNNVV